MARVPLREKPTSESLSPLLRWAGSKRKLLPIIRAQIPEDFERYIEPFSGSACLFFVLRPCSALIGDLNADLISAYETIRRHPFRTADRVASFRRTSQNYYRIRGQNPNKLSEIDRAARFVYLNRHCFNGVYRTNRKGEFNVPFGSRLGLVPNRRHFNRCAHALRKAELISGDFEEIVARAGAGDFVYLDPPYAKEDSRQRGEYGYASFGTNDIVRLETALLEADRRGAHFLLSYADCEEINGIQNRWHSTSISVRRQVAGFHRHRQIVSEVLISNRPLKLFTVPK